MLRHEPFVGICAKDHPFAGRQIPIEDMLAETLLLREQGSGTRAITERMLGAMGYTPAQFARTVCISSFGLLCRLVAAGSGVSFVYHAVTDSWPSIAVFQLENVPLQHAFHYVYLRDCGTERVIEEFGEI